VRFVDQTSFGALGDSFYEYLLKQWLFTGRTEPKYRRMYDEVRRSAGPLLLHC
jgi:mannosyl-oligosaccharide alpha-1,2-mannosidase